MAKKKTEVTIPDPEPAQLDADPSDPDLDREERRRLRHQRRFFLRGPHWHRKWLDVVEQKDPEAFEDLVFWRRQNPQEFRKRLVRWCLANAVYEHHLYTSRDLPPLEERREEG